MNKIIRWVFVLLSVTFSISASASNAENECLFSWGEKNYPQFFSPAGATSITEPDGNYHRHYSGTDTDLGVSLGKHLFVVGPVFGGLLDLGDVAPWVAQAGCFSLTSAPTIPQPVPTLYSDVFELFIASDNGGYRNRLISIADSIGSSSTSCGYTKIETANGTTFRAMLEDSVRNSGGNVILSNPSEWCGTAMSETNCIKQFDNVIVVDGRKDASTNIEIRMLGLLSGQSSVVKFDSSSRGATLSSVTKDASVTSGSCSNTGQTTPNSDAINGSWTGYEFSYTSTTRSGATTPRSMSCANQVCTLSTGVTLPIFSFSKGTWKTQAGGASIAGAVLTPGFQLLSMFLCNAPLDQARTLESCGFYTFKR